MPGISQSPLSFKVSFDYNVGWFSFNMYPKVNKEVFISLLFVKGIKDAKKAIEKPLVKSCRVQPGEKDR